MWHKNQYDGYILRELISKETVKKVIYSCNNHTTVKLVKLFKINIVDNKVLRKESICTDDILKVFYKEKYVIQQTFGQYRIDLYFPDYKLAIECDEFDHKDRNKEYEKQREQFIKQKGVTLIRFNPDDSQFSILNVISKFNYNIQKFYINKKMTEKLVNTINSINVKLFLNKNDKSYLHDKLLLLKSKTSKEEKKMLKPIIEVLEKIRLNKNDRKQIIEEKKSLIKIINKYEEVFEEEDNDETVDEKMNEDDVEKLLDGKIHKYNKYNKNHPMEGISFNKAKNKYTIIYKNINTTSKDLEIACQKIIDIFCHKKNDLFGQKVAKIKFTYQDYYFLTYI